MTCFIRALDVSRLLGTLCYGFWKENGSRSKLLIKYGFRCDFVAFQKENGETITFELFALLYACPIKSESKYVK